VDRGLAVALTAGVGGAIALQAPINSHLGKTVGTFQAAFVSFAMARAGAAVDHDLARHGHRAARGGRVPGRPQLDALPQPRTEDGTRAVRTTPSGLPCRARTTSSVS
jgi:hypothetical protein